MLEPGVRLGPTELGVLASAGRAALLAGPRPRVAIVTTGDELVAPDAELTPGAVRNSSAFVIPALVALAGGEAIGPRTPSMTASGWVTRSLPRSRPMWP